MDASFYKKLSNGIQKTIARSLPIVTGSVIILFIQQLVSYVESSVGKVKEPKYFQKMIEENPELLKEKPESVGKLWRTLYLSSPTLAKDPVAAGAFIRQSIGRGYIEEWGGPAPDTYKTLVEIEKDFKDKKTSKDFSPIGKAVTVGMLGEVERALGETWVDSDKMKEMMFKAQSDL